MHPMQVRYQAAPRPDKASFNRLRGRLKGSARAQNDTPFLRAWRGQLESAPQHLHELLQLHPHLPHNLLRLGGIGTSLFAAEFVAGAADGETLVV